MAAATNAEKKHPRQLRVLLACFTVIEVSLVAVALDLQDGGAFALPGLLTAAVMGGIALQHVRGADPSSRWQMGWIDVGLVFMMTEIAGMAGLYLLLPTLSARWFDLVPGASVWPPLVGGSAVVCVGSIMVAALSLRWLPGENVVWGDE